MIFGDAMRHVAKSTLGLIEVCCIVGYTRSHSMCKDVRASLDWVTVVIEEVDGDMFMWSKRQCTPFVVQSPG